MNALKCDLCGGTNIIKEDEFFVCQHCRTKYTPEAARRMMIEGNVEVTGTVQIDKSNEVENALINARRAYIDQNYEEAFSLFSNALVIDPNNPEAILYKGLASSWGGTIALPKSQEAINAYIRSVSLKHEETGDSKEFFAFVLEAEHATHSFMLALNNLFVGYYNKVANAAGLTIVSPARDEAKAKMQNNARNLAEMCRMMVSSAFELTKDGCAQIFL